MQDGDQGKDIPSSLGKPYTRRWASSLVDLVFRLVAGSGEVDRTLEDFEIIAQVRSMDQITLTHPPQITSWWNACFGLS